MNWSLRPAVFTANIIFFFLLPFARTLCAQEWQWQNPLPQGNNILSIKFIDKSHGWALTNHSFLRTTDGGEHWTNQNFHFNKPVFGFTFVDTLRGWVVGDNQVILHTTDGGITWQVQTNYESVNLKNFRDSGIHTFDQLISSPLSNNVEFATLLQNVSFTDSLYGWIAGRGTILHTTDGGRSWKNLSPKEFFFFTDIYFADTNRGWAVDNLGKIVGTTDGGNSWKELSIIDPNWEQNKKADGDQPYVGDQKIIFCDSLHGFVESNFYGSSYTTDGGVTWIRGIKDYFRWPHNICFVDRKHGWFYSHEVCYETTNAGATWEKNELRTHALRGLNTNTVSFVDSMDGWIAGGNGMIQHTTDGGLSWISQQKGTLKKFTAVAFVDSNNGWISDYDNNSNVVIWHTTNGGLNWSPQQTDCKQYMKSLMFVDTRSGWAVGYGGTILHSSDAGKSWELQKSDSKKELSQVVFLDSNVGWIVGSGGLILCTTDGGYHWNEQISMTNFNLYSLAMLDKETGWAVGENGIVLHTTNGGKDWIRVAVGVKSMTGVVYHVYFYGKENGWISGYQEIIRTTDGGKSWFPCAHPKDESFYTMVFCNSENGWLIGSYGVIFRTYDGGASWQMDSFIVNDYGTGIAFTDPDHGWIIGEHGKILHYH